MITTPIGFARITAFSAAMPPVRAVFAAVTAPVTAAHVRKAPMSPPTASAAPPRVAARTPSQEEFCWTQVPKSRRAGMRLVLNQS